MAGRPRSGLALGEGGAGGLTGVKLGVKFAPFCLPGISESGVAIDAADLVVPGDVRNVAAAAVSLTDIAGGGERDHGDGAYDGSKDAESNQRDDDSGNSFGH